MPRSLLETTCSVALKVAARVTNFLLEPNELGGVQTLKGATEDGGKD